MLLLTLYLYYNEIDVGNPLGSHAAINKFGVVHVSIAFLPPEIAFRLNSILFSTLLRAKDMKNCCNLKLFQHLISEFNYLERTGITRGSISPGTDT